MAEPEFREDLMEQEDSQEVQELISKPKSVVVRPSSSSSIVRKSLQYFRPYSQQEAQLFETGQSEHAGVFG